MVEVSVTVTSEVHDPEEDWIRSTQEVDVDVTVEGGMVETVVVVSVEMEVDTVSDVPKRVAVGVGVHAIIAVADDCAVDDELGERRGVKESAEGCDTVAIAIAMRLQN